MLLNGLQYICLISVFSQSLLIVLLKKCELFLFNSIKILH